MGAIKLGDRTGLYIEGSGRLDDRSIKEEVLERVASTMTAGQMNRG